jgi:hypothetical protein
METEENGFSLALPGLPEPISFETAVEVLAFFERELAHWSEFQTRVASVEQASAYVKAIPASAVKQWRNMLNAVKQVIDTTDSRLVSEALQSTLNGFTRDARLRSLIVSSSREGAKILQLVDHDVIAAAFLHSLYTGTQLASVFAPSDAAAATEFFRTLPRIVSDVLGGGDIEYLAARAVENANQVQATRESLERIKTQAEGMLSTEQQRFTDLSTEIGTLQHAALKEFQDHAENQRRGVEEAWAALRSSLFTAIKLRAPRTYWEEKAKDHRRAAVGWALGFLACLLLGILSPVFITPELASSMTAISANVISQSAAPASSANSLLAQPPQPASAGNTKNLAPQTSPTAIRVNQPIPSNTASWILPLVSLGVPLFIALWLARMTARQFGEHLLRQQDALERSVMVETFLALNSKETGEALAGLEANFPIILQAIFRAGPGLNTDDSPPLGAVDALYRSARSAHQK